MPVQVTNYQCPACTGPLHFDGESGKLKCDYCGKSYTVEEIEALYAAKDAKAANAQKAAEKQAAADAAAQNPDDAAQPQDAQAQTVQDPNADPNAGAIPESEKQAYNNSSWDESTISPDWGEDSANMRAYNCPSCGAELMCDASTAATQCPYCGNPAIVPGQFTNAKKPDSIIPFKLDKNAAVAALKQHYGKRLFLPKAFTAGNQIQKIQGVYVPFWLFDGDTVSDCRYEGTNSFTSRQGDYRVTRTDHYSVRRSGTVAFTGIPADASRRMPDELMDSVEPYDYSEMKPFSTAYLPGYMADKYDVSIDETAPRADLRCRNTAQDVMRSDVRGYMAVAPLQEETYINRGAVHYALMPVWLLKTKWGNKDYLFAMNGQTGKFVGDLPTSKGRFFACFAAIATAITLGLFLTGAGTQIVTALGVMMS